MTLIGYQGYLQPAFACVLLLESVMHGLGVSEYHMSVLCTL